MLVCPHRATRQKDAGCVIICSVVQQNFVRETVAYGKIDVRMEVFVRLVAHAVSAASYPDSGLGFEQWLAVVMQFGRRSMFWANISPLSARSKNKQNKRRQQEAGIASPS
jgi:hypothetical protein